MKPAKHLIVLLAAFLLPSKANAAWSYPVAHAAQNPMLDGDMTDRIWDTATLLESFHTYGAGVPTRRQIRLLWAENGLYISAIIEDKQVISRGSLQNDQLWKGDVIEWFIKPSAKEEPYYEFQVNPSGVRLEFLIEDSGTSYETLKKQKSLGLRSAVMRTSFGWQVEAIMPWSVFEKTGGAPKPGDEWRFTFAFYDYTEGEPAPLLGSTAALKKPDFHRTDEYDTLRFLAPLNPLR